MKVREFIENLIKNNLSLVFASVHAKDLNRFLQSLTATTIELSEYADNLDQFYKKLQEGIPATLDDDAQGMVVYDIPTNKSWLTQVGRFSFWAQVVELVINLAGEIKIKELLEMDTNRLFSWICSYLKKVNKDKDIVRVPMFMYSKGNSTRIITPLYRDTLNPIERDFKIIQPVEVTVSDNKDISVDSERVREQTDNGATLPLPETNNTFTYILEEFPYAGTKTVINFSLSMEPSQELYAMLKDLNELRTIIGSSTSYQIPDPYIKQTTKTVSETTNINLEFFNYNKTESLSTAPSLRNVKINTYEDLVKTYILLLSAINKELIENHGTTLTVTYLHTWSLFNIASWADDPEKFIKNYINKFESSVSAMIDLDELSIPSVLKDNREFAYDIFLTITENGADEKRITHIDRTFAYTSSSLDLSFHILPPDILNDIDSSSSIEKKFDIIYNNADDAEMVIRCEATGLGVITTDPNTDNTENIMVILTSDEDSDYSNTVPEDIYDYVVNGTKDEMYLQGVTIGIKNIDHIIYEFSRSSEPIDLDRYDFMAPEINTYLIPIPDQISSYLKLRHFSKKHRYLPLAKVHWTQRIQEMTLDDVTIDSEVSKRKGFKNSLKRIFHGQKKIKVDRVLNTLMSELNTNIMNFPFSPFRFTCEAQTEQTVNSSVMGSLIYKYVVEDITNDAREIFHPMLRSILKGLRNPVELKKTSLAKYINDINDINGKRNLSNEEIDVILRVHDSLIHYITSRYINDQSEYDIAGKSKDKEIIHVNNGKFYLINTEMQSYLEKLGSHDDLTRIMNRLFEDLMSEYETIYDGLDNLMSAKKIGSIYVSDSKNTTNIKFIDEEMTYIRPFDKRGINRSVLKSKDFINNQSFLKETSRTFWNVMNELIEDESDSKLISKKALNTLYDIIFFVPVYFHKIYYVRNNQ